MNLKHFGDSYDIVKKSMLSWLAPFGAWRTHPMFTEHVSEEQANSFGRFLDTPLLSSEVLTSRTDRSRYFAACCGEFHLFLDPDTGVRCGSTRRFNSPNHLYGEELIAIVRSRPDNLTLVFDQSFARGAADSDLQSKFAFFDSRRVAACAYWSHAPFLLLSTNNALLDHARDRILYASGLPAWRIRTVAHPSSSVPV